MKTEELVNEYLKEHRHDVLLNPYDGLIEFSELFLSELMKDAVEGDIGIILHDKRADLFVRSKGYLPKSLGIKCNDKVRIIVVKAEEE